MFSLKGLSAALLTWGAIANAFCSEANVCATAIVPQTNSQDLYVQITAPSDSGWAGVGLGTRMKGATIFVIYPNAAKNNLTLSPRTGTGNIEPKHDSSIKVTVLGGTGIKDGKWTMNFACHNCRGAVDVTSTNAKFIYAKGGGDSISSDKPDASIYQHGTRGQFSMAVAKTTSSNPFVTTSNTGGNSTDTDSTNSTDSNDSNTSGTSGNSGKSSASMSKPDRTLLAHGMAFIATSAFITSFL